MAKKLKSIRVPPLTFSPICFLDCARGGSAEWVHSYLCNEHPEIEIRVHGNKNRSFRQVILGEDFEHYETVNSAYRALVRRRKDGESISPRHVYDNSQLSSDEGNVRKKKSRRNSRKRK